MLREWRKFKGWAVLEYFLKSPNTKVHIRGLARDIDVSSLSARKYLQNYRDAGILKEEKVANSLIYSLNNYLPLVKSLKRFYFLAELDGLDKIPEGIGSVAVFGEYASGDYTENSDIDILVISQDKPDLSFLKKIEKRLAKTIDITNMTLGEWRGLVKKGDGFADSILRNHILIYGAQI